MATPPKGAVPQELIDALADVSAATNEVAAVVDSLRAIINTSMTQADVDGVKATLAETSARLRAIAADPNVPVPPTPPPPVFKKR